MMKSNDDQMKKSAKDIEELSKSFMKFTKKSDEQFASIKDQIKKQNDEQFASIQEQIKKQFAEQFAAMITALRKSPIAASSGEVPIEENHQGQSLWSSSLPSSSAISFSNGLVENSLDEMIDNDEVSCLEDDEVSGLEGASTAGNVCWFLQWECFVGSSTVDFLQWEHSFVVMLSKNIHLLVMFDKLPKPAKTTTTTYKLFGDDLDVSTMMGFQTGATLDQVLGNSTGIQLLEKFEGSISTKQKEIKVACNAFGELPRLFFIVINGVDHDFEMMLGKQDVELQVGKMLLFTFDPGGTSWFHDSCDSLLFTDDKQPFGKSVLAFYKAGKVMLIVLFSWCIGKDSGTTVEVIIVEFDRFLLSITTNECLAKALVTWNLLIAYMVGHCCSL